MADAGVASLRKICTGCGDALPLSRFSADRSKPDGLQTRCKACRSAADRARYRKSGERVRERSARRYEADKARHRANAADWARRHPEKVAASRRAWRERNRTREIEAQRLTFAEKVKDPTYRLNRAISRGVWGGLRSRKDGRRWQALLGYSVQDLIAHLERQFQSGMSWANYGRNGWHVDHIRPVTSFTFSTVDDPQFRECWALENLQPLWEPDNIRKGNRLPSATIQQSR